MPVQSPEAAESILRVATPFMPRPLHQSYGATGFPFYLILKRCCRRLLSKIFSAAPGLQHGETAAISIMSMPYDCMSVSHADASHIKGTSHRKMLGATCNSFPLQRQQGILPNAGSASPFSVVGTWLFVCKGKCLASIGISLLAFRIL